MPAPSPEKAAAIAAGELTYFTGKPCKRGHISHRFVSGGQCVECNNEHSKKGREANPGRHAAYHREARRRDPSKNQIAVRSYRDRNPGIHAEQVRSWRGKNKDRYRDLMRASNARRRARKRENGGSYSADDILALHEKQKGHCAGCGRKLKEYHVDHIHPLSKGGANYPSNLQLLCPPCNLGKRNYDPIEWAQAHGRLL